MKKLFSDIVTVLIIIALLPCLMPMAFMYAVIMEENGALVFASLILSLLNAAVLWWLIYKVFSM